MANPLDNAQTLRDVHELLKQQQARQVRFARAAACAPPRLRARARSAQRGVTPEHEAILEGVYEVRAQQQALRMRPGCAFLTRRSLPPSALLQLERRPQPHTELRLAAQLDLDVLAVKARMNAASARAWLTRARLAGLVPLAPPAHAAHPQR